MRKKLFAALGEVERVFFFTGEVLKLHKSRFGSEPQSTSQTLDLIMIENIE